MRIRFTVGMLLCLAAAISSSGCRHKREVNPPETYAVKGTVQSASGRVPAGCQIQFMPDDPKCMAEGQIGADGTFTLQTRYEGVLCDGAAEGTYSVTIIPPLGGPATGVSGPISLPGTIQIKPQENTLTIPLP